MLRSVHKYLLQFFVVFCLAACAGVSEIGNPSEGDSNFISFNVSETMTKVSNDDIKDHLLCIYIFDDGNPLGNRNWSKYRLKYDNESQCWRFWNGESYEDIEWGTGNHEFYAYSDTEYSIDDMGDVSPAYDDDNKSLKYTGTINIAQTDSQNYKKDMIYASATRDVTTHGYGSVSLEFYHALASLLIELKNNSDSEKNITECSLRGVKLEATNPTIDFADGSITADWGSVDNDGIAFEGGTVAQGESFIATGGPVVIWPQPIENQCLELSIPGVSNIVNIKDFDPEMTNWEAGKLYHYIVNIPSPVVLGSPSASISHTMTDGVLTGSAVTLDLGGATDEQLKKIKGLTVNVKRDGTIYKTYSAGDDVVASSNTISISSGRNYLPKGAYTVECSYISGLDKVSFTIDVDSPAPPTELLTYNVTANADTPGKLTVTNASVNISQSVLDELSLSDISLNFAADGGNSYEVKDISPVSLGADFTPVETKVVAGVYNLTSSVKFDGVELETDDTYTVPGVGWYVNNDGTFSETFISDYSIAKIFYLGSLLTDTQLVTDHSYCTLGLAYEVDSSTGNIKINASAQSWNPSSTDLQELSSMDNDYISYSSTDNIHGYSNTVAIKEFYNRGFISYGTESAVIANVTSPWYIPSVGEFKLIANEVFDSTPYLYVWTSTVGHYQLNAWYPHKYYACYIIISNGSIVPTSNNNISAANGDYATRPYFRILAF